MVANLSLLNGQSISKIKNLKEVFLLYGDIALVTHPGSSTINEKNTMTGVFYIPQFKFNLLSVAKLSKEFKCSAFFFPDFCLFQKLFSGKVKIIGKQDGGLYIISSNINKEQITLTASIMFIMMNTLQK